MKRSTILALTILFLFSVLPPIMQAQEIKENNDSCSTDTIDLQIVLTDYSDAYQTKWITVGSDYDFVNSAFGITISNGYNESPLMHFEDFQEDFMYKINGKTDFDKGYSYGANWAWKYPNRYLSLISIGFLQCNYPGKGFFYRDMNIAAKYYLRFMDTNLFLKAGHQTLNDSKNLGASLDLQKVLSYSRLYSGLSVGYYFDYFTYAAYLQGFVYKKIIGLRLDYERIDNYNFFNLGLSFTFNR